MESTKRSLNPQSAEYYKRLLLVADRYYFLTKKKNAILLGFWLITLIAIIEAVFIVTKVL